jgi:cytochrome P450
MVAEADRLVRSLAPSAGRRSPIDLHAEMTQYTLWVVGRILFGADVEEAIPVIRATFPVLNQHIYRRGRNPLRLPRSWPTPAQRRAAAAQRARYRVVDAVIDQRGTASGGPGRPHLAAAGRLRPADRRAAVRPGHPRPDSDLSPGRSRDHVHRASAWVRPYSSTDWLLGVSAARMRPC